MTCFLKTIINPEIASNNWFLLKQKIIDSHTAHIVWYTAMYNRKQLQHFFHCRKFDLFYLRCFFSFFTVNFIMQFLILSLIIGIPLLTLQVCLGQRLAAGSVDMWRISPLFQGVGIALLIAQAFIGIYSIVGVSWMFVYFRYVLMFNCTHILWKKLFT